MIDKIARQMTAEALRAEANAYVTCFADERDKHGHQRWGLTGRSARPASARALSAALDGRSEVRPAATVRQLLEHESDLISALTATERTALTGFLTKLEQTLLASPPDGPQE